MSREALVFILGLAILVAPFIGIPRDWKDWFFVGAGLLLMLVGYLLRRSAFLRSIENADGERHAEAFAESHGQQTETSASAEDAMTLDDTQTA